MPIPEKIPFIWNSFIEFFFFLSWSNILEMLKTIIWKIPLKHVDSGFLRLMFSDVACELQRDAYSYLDLQDLYPHLGNLRNQRFILRSQVYSSSYNLLMWAAVSKVLNQVGTHVISVNPSFFFLCAR